MNLYSFYALYENEAPTAAVRETCLLPPTANRQGIRQKHIDDVNNMRPNRETEIWTVKAL